MRTLRLLGPAAVLIALVVAGAGAQTPESRPLRLPPQQRLPMERLALEFAKKGRLEDALLLLDVLARIGHEPAALETSTKTAKELAGKVGKRQPADAPLLRGLRDAVRAMEKSLATAPEEHRYALAAEILRLDDSEPAHATLGHVKAPDGGWSTTDREELRARRGVLRDRLAKARKLPVETTIETGDHPLLVAVEGGPGVAVRAPCGYGAFVLHTAWSEAKATRVVRESLRLYAFSRAVIRGDLGYDDVPATLFVHFESETKYRRALELSREKGWISEQEYQFSKNLGGFDGSVAGERFHVAYVNREAGLEASIFLRLCFLSPDLGDAQPCLFVGHANWATLSYLGEPLPGVAYVEDLGGDRRRTGRSEMDLERYYRLRLGEGGVAGARSYLAWLAARREDPAWSQSMVDEVGKIEGLDKLKSTFAVEYLHELATFANVEKSSRPRAPDAARGADGDGGAATRRAAPETPSGRIVDALGLSLAEFEELWRAWILPPDTPLLRRLDEKETPPPADAAKALAALKAARKAAFAAPGSWRKDGKPLRDAALGFDVEILPVVLDVGLCDGCRKHARYLARHPDQAARWPDAHEEWPDRELFTPEGATAAGAGVIAPGSRTPEGSIDAWFATFYHRLPLLDPGLMRIGYGLEQGMAVLDCGSFVAPVRGGGHVAWPYDGMTDVPLSFAPELPSPVPGEDESTFGYPVTLQTASPHWGETRAEPTLELFEGTDPKTPLPAHVSTPSKPTNPDVAPANAYCLMTKSRLKPKTTYTATATWPDGRTLLWRFTTAAK